MVGHVGVCNVVEEVVQKAIGAIDCCQGSPEPVPLFVVVVGQLGVRVLQEGDHDQPIVDNQVRDDVHLYSHRCCQVSITELVPCST